MLLSPGGWRSACGLSSERCNSYKSRLRSVFLDGTEGGPKEWGSQVTTGLIALYSQFFTCSNAHVDR